MNACGGRCLPSLDITQCIHGWKHHMLYKWAIFVSLKNYFLKSGFVWEIADHLNSASSPQSILKDKFDSAQFFKINLLKDRATEEKTKKKFFHLLVHSLKWPQQPGLGKAETRRLKIHRSLPPRWHGLKYLSHLILFSQAQ